MVNDILVLKPGESVPLEQTDQDPPDDELGETDEFRLEDEDQQPRPPESSCREWP